MRNTAHTTIKTREYYGKTLELATWQMKDGSNDHGAGYYHGADLLFVRYAATEEEAILLVDATVDQSDVSKK